MHDGKDKVTQSAIAMERAGHSSRLIGVRLPPAHGSKYPKEAVVVVRPGAKSFGHFDRVVPGRDFIEIHKGLVAGNEHPFRSVNDIGSVFIVVNAYGGIAHRI